MDKADKVGCGTVDKFVMDVGCNDNVLLDVGCNDNVLLDVGCNDNVLLDERNSSSLDKNVGSLTVDNSDGSNIDS